jgi:hypothetical protein
MTKANNKHIIRGAVIDVWVECYNCEWSWQE